MAAARRNRPEKRDRVTWDNGISHRHASGWIAWGMMAYSDISNAWMVSDFIFMNDGSQNDINLTSEAALINTP